MRKTGFKKKVSLKKRHIKTDKQKKFAARKRKLEKERELYAEFGLIRPKKPRYVGLQGVLWMLASIAVRRQEFALYGGLCADGCGEKVDKWQDAHCGHFEGAGKASTRFVRENLGLQNPTCNMDQKNGRAIQYSYGKEIDKRYGAGKADELRALANTSTVMTEEYLREKIGFYRALLEGVDKS